MLYFVRKFGLVLVVELPIQIESRNELLGLRSQDLEDLVGYEIAYKEEVLYRP
jgi:hypothetical protein